MRIDSEPSAHLVARGIDVTRRLVALGLVVAVPACGTQERPVEEANSAQQQAERRRDLDRPLVVYSQGALVIEQLGRPVAAPVRVGSQPSRATMASDDTKVVEVDGSGALVGHANGTARIHAVGGASVLEVMVLAADAIRVEPSTLRLRAGEGLQVRVLTSRGEEIPASAVRWATTSPEVARVEAGVVRAGSLGGPATLTARYGDLIARASVDVAGPSIGRFIVAPERPRRRVGEVVAFHALSRGGPLDAEWSSSNDGVVSLVQGNIFRCKSRGQASVCGTVAQKKACTTVEVQP